MSDTLKFVDSTSTTGNFKPVASLDMTAGTTSNHIGGEETQPALTPGFLKTAKHPTVCLFHILFKLGALFCFLFGGLFGDYITTFVFTTFFLAFDFWTVKNVTGRMLVGMRWWNEIREDGSSEWMFESLTEEGVINVTDRTVFWAGLYIWPVVWAIFLIAYTLSLKFDWVLLIIMGLVLSSSNLVGYWKCSKHQKAQMKSWAQTQAIRAVISNFV